MIRYSRPKLSEAWSQGWDTTNLPSGGLSRSFSLVWKQQQTDPNAYGEEKAKYFYNIVLFDIFGFQGFRCGGVHWLITDWSVIQNQGGFISKSPATITINNLKMLCKTEMMLFRVPQSQCCAKLKWCCSEFHSLDFAKILNRTCLVGVYLVFSCALRINAAFFWLGAASVYDQVGSSQTTNRFANRQPKNW